MRHVMHHICERCLVYKMAKSKASSNGLYTLLPIPIAPWIDISMDFVLGPPTNYSGRDSIFVVVDKFSKMAHFILCHKSHETYHVANFFTERERLHELPKSIIPDKEPKFLNNSHAPFELVYGYNPLSPLDLTPLPILSKVDPKGLSKAQSMIRLHERVRTFMESQGKRYAGRPNRDKEGRVFAHL
ncbi:hypothetical protein CR513_33183, partial [Mucuna pruriens]